MDFTGVGRIVFGGWIAIALLPDASAQFHGGKSAKQPPQQQASAAMAGASRGGGSVVTGGGLGGGDMILPQEVQERFKDNKVKLSQMQGKPIDVWGRAIYHGDDSYTESKHEVEAKTLKQVTKSKNGVTLQERMITLDESDRPIEALIYDGRKQLKYRGVQVYDSFGRFSEEQIYDTKGKLIRRKVQEYSPRGEKLPLRSWDYVANVPEDLKMVITRDDDISVGSSGAGRQGTASPKSGNSSNAAAPASGQKKGLKGIFGSKKNN
ncbi:MAG TPA: hypothetical protein PLA50_09385 [Bacteroidia bacterium]|nr:hypothetical protein [Bacteroidia bacterium]